MNINKPSKVFVCGLALFLASCASRPPQMELERVAKDWSMTVRASQVMPIYPLEEDLRPGDVYLITNSIESEIESWNRRGFLPLVNRWARIPIDPSKYDTFFGNASGANPPPSFNRHPMAAFPSYTFSVDRRGALGLAIPLSSVPVALSISGARSATGSVVLSGATTIGLPDMVMDTRIQEWAKEDKVKEALKSKAEATENPLLLRAITRVFSVSGATISLAFEQAGGIGVQAGAPPATPELLGASQEDFDKLIAQLNKKIELQKSQSEAAPVEIPTESSSEPNPNPQLAALEAELAEVQQLKSLSQIQALRRNVERAAMIDQFGGFILPGGTGRITGRTASGVSMEETFDKPLVVGYWATEYLVYEDGSLISLGGIKNLVDNPDDYRSRVELVWKFMNEKTKNPLPFKPNKQLP
jgi:hypothetical protein